MPPARRALIAGLGLIGGSIGQALRARGWSVDFVDPAVSAEEAIARGAAERKLSDVPSAGPHVALDIVIVATPVDAALRILEDIDRDLLVTTVCSVMQPLREVVQRRRLRCVAGHPLAGSHERSLNAARGDLFAGKHWFLEDGVREPIVDEVVDACGAVIERVNAAEHDAALALTSHLPQLLSTALAAVLDDEPQRARYAGSGLRTFLRLAGSDGAVWRSVLTANRENLEGPLRAVARVAEQILRGQDDDAFQKAQHFLASIEEPGSQS